MRPVDDNNNWYYTRARVLFARYCGQINGSRKRLAVRRVRWNIIASTTVRSVVSLRIIIRYKSITIVMSEKNVVESIITCFSAERIRTIIIIIIQVRDNDIIIKSRERVSESEGETDKRSSRAEYLLLLLLL